MSWTMEATTWCPANISDLSLTSSDSFLSRPSLLSWQVGVLWFQRSGFEFWNGYFALFCYLYIVKHYWPWLRGRGLPGVWSFSAVEKIKTTNLCACANTWTEGHLKSWSLHGIIWTCCITCAHQLGPTTRAIQLYNISIMNTVRHWLLCTKLTFRIVWE